MTAEGPLLVVTAGDAKIDNHKYKETFGCKAKMLTPEEAVDMVRAYGAERVLFGTDFPMWCPKDEVRKFLALPLTEEERRLIAWDNGAKLLHLGSLACAAGA